MIRLVAVNRNTNTAVLSRDGVFVFVDIDEKDVAHVDTECSLSESDGWETSNQEVPSLWVELVEAATTSLSVHSEEHADSGRIFRVPRNVQKVSDTFDSDTTTLKYVHEFSVNNVNEPQIVRDWVNKIVTQFPVPDSIIASAFVPEETSIYFGRVSEEGTTVCDAMYALNEAGDWAERQDGEWVPVEGEITPDESYDLIMLDPESAASLAQWADGPDELDGGSLELANLNTTESGLFYAAEAELDMEFLDRMFDVYDSTERSINAKKQVRGQGGRFGPNPGGGEGTAEAPKARLSTPLPVIPDVSARIDQYLADVEAARGGSEPSEPGSGIEDPEKKKKFSNADKLKASLEVLDKSKSDFAVTAEQSGVPTTDVKPLYIAIVDDIDTDAVLDLVSLVPPAKGVQGDVTAWKRAAGQWVAANEILAQLRGSTPPSCVEVSDPAMLKEVIAQVDKSTAEEGQEQAPEGETEVAPDGTAPANQPAQPKNVPGVEMKKSNFSAHGDLNSLIARGYAFSDGSLLIRNSTDLRNAIDQAVGYEQQLHVVKRARALNRVDMLPQHWNIKEASSRQELWGPYGELLPVVAAGGLDRNRGGAEKLRHYWTRGLGGAKIGWGSPRDWTRCVAYLSKYLGPRAKGYCALRHKEQVGYYPGDRRNK